jgi:hypothetical protein
VPAPVGRGRRSRREDVTEHGDEAVGALERHEVARVLHDLEPAPGDEVVGGVGMGDGDHAVPRPPHDERRHLGREVQAVARAHPLT